MRFRPRTLRFAHVLAAWLALAYAALAPRPACAEDSDPKAEEPAIRLGPGALPAVEYPKTAVRFGVVDAVLSGLGASMALGATIAGPAGDGPHGTGTPFDESVRTALLPSSFDVQLLFRDTSDALLGVALSYAFIGDALIHASWLRKSADVGIQMALIDSEVTLLTLGVSQLTANAVGRERPFGRTCGSELDPDSAQCTWNDRYLSFFSTHTSLTFAMAAVTCAHHNALGLSGRHPWIPCAVGFTAAAATAFSRIMADQHYATDVLTGAAVGTLIGFAVPAVHYGFGRFRPGGSASPTHVVVLPTFGGVSVTGVW